MREMETCKMLPVSLTAMGAEWGSSTSLEEASGRKPCRLPTTCTSSVYNVYNESILEWMIF